MSEIRYSRQTCIEGWKQENLSRARVLMVGCGALGNHIGLGLIGLGIGNIFLYDHDLIEDHNLNRQSLFTNEDIGKKKADALKKRLLERNSKINITASTDKVTEENVSLILQKIDLVIDCVDNVETRQLLSRECLINNIPLVHGGISWDGGQVGVITRHTACLSCIFPEKKVPNAPCRDEVMPSVVYCSQIIAGIMVEQIRKVLNPLPGELGPIGPLLYYYPNELNHFAYKPIARRHGCECMEILEEFAPEILQQEEEARKRKSEEDNNALAMLGLTKDNKTTKNPISNDNEEILGEKKSNSKKKSSKAGK
jgi:molybdopterin/thiamine biosynthesis adenylyltransferase